jgi:hypothetical protein
MALALAGIGLGVGLLVALVSYLLPTTGSGRGAPPDRGAHRPALLAGLGLTVLLYLLTLPTSGHFSPGQRLGQGFLIGGVLGLLAAFGSARLKRGEQSYWPYASVLCLSLALSAVSLTFLLFSHNPEDALLGCALGLGLVAGVFRATQGEEISAPLEAGAVLGATLVAGCLLSLYHFDTRVQAGWWPYALVLASAWLLGAAMLYTWGAGLAKAGKPVLPVLLATAALGLVLTVLVGHLLANHLGTTGALLPLLLTGVVAGALLLWLRESQPAGAAAALYRLRAAALSALVVVFLLILSFKLQQAFGTAVALLALWAVAIAPMVRGAGFSSLLPLLTLGANFLLLRLFLERIGAGPSDVSPDLHYTLVGLILGALLPTVYASLQERLGMGRMVLLGLVTLATPVVVVALWGPDAAVGLLAGLVVGPALALLLGQALPGPWIAPAGLISLGMGLVMVQFGASLSLLYQLPRVDKALLAGGVALLLVIWVVGFGLVGGRAARRAVSAQEG